MYQVEESKRNSISMCTHVLFSDLKHCRTGLKINVLYALLDVFDELQGIWKCGEIHVLSSMFDTFSQLSLN